MLLGAIALSTGPVDAFGRTWQLNALYLCVAMLLLGTQIAQLGLVARTFGAVQLGDPDPFLTRLYHRIRLEHALLGGAVVLAMGLVVLVAVFATWAAGGFGELTHDYPAVIGFALTGLGVQTIFTAFLVSIVGRPPAVSQPLAGGVRLPAEMERGETTLVR